MGIALYSRRIVAAKVEAGGSQGTQGTHTPPAASSDAIPLVRSASVGIQPFRVDRPTLRLSLTDLPDIYPGKATVEINFSFELHANSAYVAGASGSVTSSMRSHSFRVLQGCGMRHQAEAQNLYAYDLTGVTTDNGPLRHGEIVTGTGVTAGNAWRVHGDTFADDGALIVDQGAGGPLSGGSLTGADSGTVVTVGTRNTT